MKISINGRRMAVTSRLGRALVRSGRARPMQVEPAESAQDEVEADEADDLQVEPAEPERHKRRYRRRDMQAE